MPDTAALQALLDVGGPVRIPAGAYTIDAPLLIHHPHTNVDADAATITYTGTDGGPAVVLGVGGTPRRGIRLAGVRLVNGGIFCDYAAQALVERCWVYEAPVGLKIDRGYEFRAVGLRIENPTLYGVHVTGEGNDQYLDHIRVVGNPVAQPTAGVFLENTAGAWLHNVGTIYCNDGFKIRPSNNSQSIKYLFTSQCSADTGNGHGWLVDGTLGKVTGLNMSQDWAGTNQKSGFTFQAVYDLRLNQAWAINNKWHGIHVVQGEDVGVSNAACTGNGTAMMPNYHGIVMGNVQRYRVQGCRSGQFDNYAFSQGYGFFVASPAATGTQDDNDFARNILG